MYHVTENLSQNHLVMFDSTSLTNEEVTLIKSVVPDLDLNDCVVYNRLQ